MESNALFRSGDGNIMIDDLFRGVGENLMFDSTGVFVGACINPRILICIICLPVHLWVCVTGQARWLVELEKKGVDCWFFVDLRLYSPRASEDSGPGVGKTHKGDVFKACSLVTIFCQILSFLKSSHKLEERQPLGNGLCKLNESLSSQHRKWRCLRL